MILPKQKILFVHIPKTGGSSIAHGLFSLDGITYNSYYKLGVKLSENYLCAGEYKHAKASVLKERLGEDYNNYFKFAVVRNPWDRVASQFNWWQIHGGKNSFNEYLKKMEKQPNLQFPSQKSFVTENDKLIVDAVYRFEDLPKISKKFKFKLVHKKNRSEGVAKVSDTFRKDINKLVLSKYKEDLEFFDFKPDQPAEKNIVKL